MTPKDTSETKQLHQDTRQLLETFDPSRLCPYLNTTTSDAYDAQAAFYNIIREGDELEGVCMLVVWCVSLNMLADLLLSRCRLCVKNTALKEYRCLQVTCRVQELESSKQRSKPPHGYSNCHYALFKGNYDIILFGGGRSQCVLPLNETLAAQKKKFSRVQ